MSIGESAGILLFRRTRRGVQVLLGHPGGPYFAKKDEGVWSIPKGLIELNEDLEVAARREFEEETGLEVVGTLVPLGNVRQRSGKVVHAFALEGDVPDGHDTGSNQFELEWPPRSGNREMFPEIDRLEFFTLREARRKLTAGQEEFLDRLDEYLKNGR